MAVTIRGGGRLRAFLDNFRKRVETAQAVKAGFLEGATYPDGTPVAQIAAVQEFGAVIQHPGGTRYITDAIVGKKGREGVATRFVGRGFQGETKTTAAHAITIPSRPFFRTAIAVNKQQWATVLGETLKKSGYNATTALMTAGEKMKDDIQSSIERGKWDKNAPSTARQKAKRGREPYPLRDSGMMLRAVASEVER